MAHNGPKMGVTVVELTTELMVVILALNQIARMVISSVVQTKAKTEFRRIFFFQKKNNY